MAHSVRVAIDVGGTFTDVVKLDTVSGELRFEKVATTPDDPRRGVLDAFTAAGAELDDVELFNHGTTLGLNSLLTRSGARVAIIATKGFRDVYLLGRTDRRTMYDLTYRKPTPLLRRRDTFEVSGRMLFDGRVAAELDEAEAYRVASAIASGGYQAIAVALLHSYANPTHELRLREILHEVAPGVEVTLSHELSREYREYERTSTAVLDAYIKPIVRSYISMLERDLAAGGFGGGFLMSRSGGGAMTATAAAEQPVNLILSGPAGGVIGAAALSRDLDLPNIITIDMGGTSLDASLVVNHEPVMYSGAEFEGLPINSPSLYIHTIGAGGGSLVFTDAAGALQVGPRSAGATPGPASYRRGGTQPTFTDACLLVGYLGADLPLGGSLALDYDAAEQAMADVAERLGMTTTELSRGVLRITTTKIVGAVRAITIEHGHNPGDFALMPFGGGGGLAAVDVAREMGIPTVVVPPGQGAFSALGMLMADVQHDDARTVVAPLAGLDADFFDAEFAEMESMAAARLDVEGFGSEQRDLQRSVDVRYSGQEHTVTVPYQAGDAPADLLAEAFTHMHKHMYGHSMSDPLEITALRLRSVGVVDKPKLPSAPLRPSGRPERELVRRVQTTAGPADYHVYLRESLCAGDRISGPAVIAEHTATTILHDGDRLAVGRLGELIIHVDVEGAGL